MKKMPKPLWAGLIGTVFGAGLIPVAPGTFGAIAAMPVVYLMRDCSILIWILASVATFVIGTIAAHYIQKTHPDDDPQIIVVDEFVGILITFIGAPISVGSMIFGLAAFRVFDIWKPYPVGWIDKHVKGGLGIMLDDVAAGVLALVALQLGIALI